FAAEDKHTAHETAVEELKRRFAVGDPGAVAEYFVYLLQASVYPDGFPNGVKVAYVPKSRQLVVEKDLPPLEVVPDVSSFRYVRARDEITAEVVRQLSGKLSTGN